MKRGLKPYPAAVAVRMIKERLGCSLREAVDILQSAK